MNNDKNHNLGDNIQDIVREAVSTMDFKKLNNEITTSVNSALAEVRSALGIQAKGDRLRGNEPKPGTWRPAEPHNMQEQRQHSQRTRQQGQPGQPGAPGIGWRNWGQQKSQTPQAYVSERNQPGRQLKRGVRIPYIPKGRVTGILVGVFGGIGLSCFTISIIVFSILAMTIQAPIFGQLILGFIAPFIACCMIVRAGKTIRERNRRLNIYLKQLQYKGFCTLKELSGAVGESERFVLRDIKKMLSLGMFPEGHLDEKGTCFMATRDSYEQYSIAQSGYEQRLVEDNSRLKEEQERLLRQNYDLKNRYERQIPVTEDPYKNLSPEVREAIISGREHIKKIKDANDAIPGEEMSAKLDRLELVIDRILYHIEKHPEQLSEIRRFMDYYLPTTLKLVNTYRDFDSQLLQGDNIITAKEEIIKTLDTINSAFERLLDSMFEEAAMDVSTDISVLETMLAQEGLTGSDFNVDHPL